MGAMGFGCKKQPKEIEKRYRKHKPQNIEGQAAALSPSPRCHILKIHRKRKKMPLKNDHLAVTMAKHVNMKDEDGKTIGRHYKCKGCDFDIGTRAACVTHACRGHTDECIGHVSSVTHFILP